MTTDAQSQEALESMSREIGAGTREIHVDVKAMCATYAKIKPKLLIALPWIEKLPSGALIATGIRFLMGIADLVCPVK
jgi:hypothetical protein